MTNNIPDEKLMPITRYFDHTKLAHLYLPKYRNNIDDKLLIGIGLTEADFTESIIATANLLQFKRNKYFFTFQTIHDYESLTSIIFKYTSPNPANDNSLKIAIYDKYPKQDPKKSWVINLPGKQSEYKFELPKPISQFSFGRGRTDFHLVINPEHKIQIQEVQLLGKKVDLDKYKTINKNSSSFLAIKKDFYESILAENEEKWINYINRIRNVN